MLRVSLATIIAMIATSTATLGDVLILKNGKRIEGDVTKDTRKYIIVTEDGDELLFKRDEVEDCLFDPVTGWEARQMFEEFRRLVEPVLSAPEPEQYAWLTQVRNHASSYQYDSETGAVAYRATASGRNIFGTDVTKTVAGGSRRTTADSDYESTTEEFARRDKGIDDVFVDDWSRYIDLYTALYKDPRYKQLVRRRPGSLMDFAMNPPPGYEVGADAVRSVLVNVNQVIRLAGDTKKRIDAIPNRQRILHRKIEEAQNDVARAKDKLSAADNRKEYDRAERRLNNAKDDLRDRVTDIQTELARAGDVAERKVKDLATKRTETQRSIAAAVDQLEVAAPGAEAVAPVRRSESADLESAVTKAAAVIKAYRKHAKGMNEVGLAQLRQQVIDRITEVFTEQPLAGSLNFGDVKRNGSDNYRLIATGANDSGTKAAVRGVFLFDSEFEDELTVCRKEQPISLIVQVTEVALDPPISDLPIDKDVQPQFNLTAEVLEVEEGCKIDLP